MGKRSGYGKSNPNYCTLSNDLGGKCKLNNVEINIKGLQKYLKPFLLSDVHEKTNYSLIIL